MIKSIIIIGAGPAGLAAGCYGQMNGYRTHLGIYVAVNALLFLINITTSPGVLWFFWPLFGWGIGIAMHAVRVLGFGRWFGPDWEEKKIREIME